MTMVERTVQEATAQIEWFGIPLVQGGQQNVALRFEATKRLEGE